MATYTGTIGDDTQVGTSVSEDFDYSQGGHDTLTGGGGGDTYHFGAAFDSQDKVIGTDGFFDWVYLDGDYSAGLTLTADNLVFVDSLYLTNFAGGRLTLAEGSVTSSMYVELDGGRVDASGLINGSVSFSVTATSGQVRMLGGANGDTAYFGGTVSRSFHFDGGGGSDTVYFGSNVDFHASDRFITNVEAITVISDISLTLRDANVAAGVTLAVTGFAALHFDGHRELDGHFNIQDWVGAADVLVGGQLGDTIGAGAGADTLIGGGGADALTGGDGADVFVFRYVGESSRVAADLITDLSAEDVIDLSAIDADKHLAGHQSFTVVASFTHHAGELMWSYDPINDVTSLLGDVTGNGKADLVIEMSGDHTDFSGLALGV